MQDSKILLKEEIFCYLVFKYRKIALIALGVYTDKIWWTHIRGWGLINGGTHIWKKKHFNLQSVKITFLPFFSSIKHLFRHTGTCIRDVNWLAYLGGVYLGGGGVVRQDLCTGRSVLTLIWVGVNFTPPPSWFSLNNSETVKAVTLEFSCI